MANKRLRTVKRNYSKRFLPAVQKAIIKYGMLQEGDKLALAVSGGKDSCALLYIMSLVRAYAPVSFSLQAVFVDMGWEMELAPLEALCSNLKIPFHVEKTKIAKIVFDVRKEKNPCSLCAKLRRGALHKAAKRLGCNRVALGHHLDDVIQTFFLNLIFSGKMDTFKPNTYLSRQDLFLIRPLVYITSETLSSLALSKNLPVVKNPCPAAGETKRHEMGTIIDFITSRYPSFYRRFVTSMEKSGIWVAQPFCFDEAGPGR
ncbi:MAG: tRNA 2-thiocytidine biosynthesis protein TtcA [Firmicutes bacterium]|nr:tRNA 2-thiocytidine biosynthesis protein TtcA [Bacillota bacterium]